MPGKITVFSSHSFSKTALHHLIRFMFQVNASIEYFRTFTSNSFLWVRVIWGRHLKRNMHMGGQPLQPAPGWNAKTAFCDRWSWNLENSQNYRFRIRCWPSHFGGFGVIDPVSLLTRTQNFKFKFIDPPFNTFWLNTLATFTQRRKSFQMDVWNS